MKNQADLYCPAGCMDHIADVDHIFAYARAFCSENDRRVCIHIGSRVWGTYPVYRLFSIFPGKGTAKYPIVIYLLLIAAGILAVWITI